MILSMRKARTTRSAAAGEDLRKRHEAAKGEEASLKQAAESEAALAAAAAEKELHPWPAKVGPFDHTSKRPSDGQPINYWKAEEGIVAGAADPSLAEGAPVLTRRTLPPRLPPASYATPGAPSPAKPGVYIADRSKQLAEAQAEAEAAAAAEMQYGGVGGGSPVPRKSQPSSLLRKSGGSTGRSTGGGGSTRLQPIVDYSYPELGQSVIAQQQAELKASTLKSARLNVYGQPRGDMPQVKNSRRIVMCHFWYCTPDM